jgi:hypothetical protein
MISTANTRYTIETLATSTRFSIRLSGANCSSLFLAVWLCGWAVGEIFVGVTLVNSVAQFLAGGETIFTGETLFLVFWLAFWTLGGGFALYTVSMQVAGREVIEVSHDAIKIAKKAFGVGLGKTYNAINIDNLRIDESLPQFAAATSQLPPALGRFSRGAAAANGALAFDYGGSTVRFGIGLSLDEARQLLGEIVRRYPQYAPLAGG